jgi:hypothetical protein
METRRPFQPVLSPAFRAQRPVSRSSASWNGFQQRWIVAGRATDHRKRFALLVAHDTALPVRNASDNRSKLSESRRRWLTIQNPVQALHSPGRIRAHEKRAQTARRAASKSSDAKSSKDARSEETQSGAGGPP